MKKCFCCTEGFRNFSLFALRLAVAAIFIYHGWDKLNNIAGTAEFFANYFPAATFFAWVVALVEFVGGLAILLGVFPTMAAFLLAVVMLVALLTVHRTGDFKSMELPIALLGATLGIVGGGSGSWKVMKDDCACDMKK